MKIFWKTLLAVMTASAVLATTFACQDENQPDSPGEENQENESKPDEEGGETEQPVETFFYSIVNSDCTEWEGEYLITYTGNRKNQNVLYVFAQWDDDTYGQPVSSGSEFTDFSSLMSEDKLSVKEMDKYNTIFTKTGSHYSINVSNVGYIGYTGSGNSLSKRDGAPTENDTEYLWNISFSNGKAILSNAKVTERQLQWNDSHPRFSTYNGSQKSLTLFRKSSNGTPPDPQPEPEPSPEPSPEPEPEPEPSPEPEHTGTGWFELPVIDDSDNNGISDSDNTLYFASHICAGGEVYGHNGKPARNYTVAYSAKHHCPVWVAAPRHKMYEHGAERTNAYKKDPKIPEDIQYHSKSTGGGCNKGHMLGSAERLSSTATNKQVFYYTNIAPQLKESFNLGGGAWNNLENYVDMFVCADTLYEVVGCYFETFKDKYGKTCNPATISFGGRNDVTRPSMFYYVLLRTKNGNTGKSLLQCETNELQCAAFVIRHNMEKGHKPQVQDMMSISDLEKITGYKYFANIPKAPKNTFNPSDWRL